MGPNSVSIASFRAALLLSEEEIGEGMRFSASCRGLARNAPDMENAEITIPAHVLQNLIRGALREIDSAA